MIEVTPSQFGANPSYTDNTSALNAMLASGNPIVLDDIYKATGPLIVTTSNISIRGTGNNCGFLFTSSSGGLTINLTHSSLNDTMGSITLDNFGLFAGSAGAGTALQILGQAQAAAVISLPTLYMNRVIIGADDNNQHYFNAGVLTKNLSNIVVTNTWFSGHQGSYADTAYWFKLTNDANVPAMGAVFSNNTWFDSQKSLWVVPSGQPSIEGISITDCLFCTNDYGIYIDCSGGGYVPPYFKLNGCQLESVVTALYIKKAAQVFVNQSVFYIDGLTANGIEIYDSNTIFFGSGNFILMTNTTQNSHSAIYVANSNVGLFSGLAIQNWNTGLTLTNTTGAFTTRDLFLNTVTTAVNNQAGTANNINP